MIIRNYNWDYESNKEIFKSLSKKEQYFVAPKGYKEIDHNRLYYYRTYYDNNIPIAFIDVYKISQNTGFILLAVRKEYQGNGFSKSILYKTINDCKNIIDLHRLIYAFDNSNKKSNNLIKKINGFKLKNKDHEKTYYEYSFLE